MLPGQFVLARARAVNPGSFAMVMATGIVSIDASQHGMPRVAHALFVLNVAMFIWLFAISTLRALRFRHELVADFADPAVGAGFLTFVAAPAYSPRNAWWSCPLHSPHAPSVQSAHSPGSR